jgi:hypothetical protein
VKRNLMFGGVALVFTPMVLTLLLLLAVQLPKMDAVTRHAPQWVKSLVASGILGEMGFDSNPVQLQRARQLDPVAATNYHPRIPGPMGRTPPDMQAMYRRQVAEKNAAKALVRRAEDQEKAGKPCVAEDIYTQAASKDTSSEVYRYAEGLGRSGLRCGDLPGSRAGLEAAILKETAFIKGTDEDQLTDVRTDLMADRQYLIVVYRKEHETALAAQVCSDLYTGAKSCTCALTKDGVSCSYKRAVAACPLRTTQSRKENATGAVAFFAS